MYRSHLHRTSTGRKLSLGLLIGLAGLAFAIALALAPAPERRLDIPLAEARESITTLTFRYRDFGSFGSPVSITLTRDQGKAHFAPGGDNDHGPISVAADGTFTIVADSGEDKIGNNTELSLVSASGSKPLIKIHTSCSQPLDTGFLYGPDGDNTAEDASEFGGSGFSSGLEVVTGDGCITPPPATPTPTATPTATATNTPVPTPTNPPEQPKTLVASCVEKAALPDIVPTQCKVIVGSEVTIEALAKFAQDFDKDGIAGYHEITTSISWPPALDTVKQLHYACPPSPEGGTVVPTLVRSDPPTVLTCSLDPPSQAAGMELVGQSEFAVSLTCLEVGIHKVQIRTDIIREDKSPVPPEKTFSSKVSLVVSCIPLPTPTPTATPTATPFAEVSPTIVIPSPTPHKKKGDVDCDGKITIVDAQWIAQLLLGVIDELPCPDEADVNKDGRISINDAQLIAQFVLQRIDSLPPR